jgi:hypothetical protein
VLASSRVLGRPSSDALPTYRAKVELKPKDAASKVSYDD